MSKSLFGYASTTKAIAKSGGWEIYDDKFSEISRDEFDNTLLPVDKFDPLKSTLEIPSPGIPPYHELIKKARNLISEYDFFYDLNAKNLPFMIYISGTNGKTTTTKMMEFLLAKYGAQMGGNVGVALGNLDPLAKIWILETSSFTLHYTTRAKPDIYVLLPITPDHLSWHKSFDDYEQAKLKPLKMMSENSVAILPKKYAKVPTKARVISYENENDLARFCDVDTSQIKFKTPFLTDALLALAVEKILLDKCDVKTLNSFIIEGNKLEEFSDIFGRIWVNDTKATNIDASIQAFKRYKDKFLHLILGGDDKGVDMSALFEALKGAKAQIYAIGSNTDKLITLGAKFNIPTIKCEFLDIAVKKIDTNYDKNSADQIALLSPAAASLDQFKSYIERGDKFKKLVLDLV